jgi:hypothetical protein
MIWQKIYRDLSPFDAARRARDEAFEQGYRVVHLFAAAQPTLFEGKDDAYVELRLVKETHERGL